MKGIGYGPDFFIIKKDEELIKEHLTRMILTSFGERVSNYYFGSNLKNYLFNFTPIVMQDIENNFSDLIEDKMPEISISNFKVTLSEEVKTIYISFDIQKKETLEKFLYEQGFNLEE